MLSFHIYLCILSEPILPILVYIIQDILEEEGSFNVAGRGNVHLPTIGNIYTYWLIGRKE